MLKEILPISVGVVIGGVLVFAGYRYLKNKKPDLFKTKDQLIKEGVAKGYAKKLQELKDNKRTYENLEAKDLTEWFKENLKDINTEVKMVIAIPTDEILNGIGYKTEDSFGIDKDKHLIQWIQDESTRELLKVSLVSFNNIESVFQSKILENDGMLIVTK